MADEWYNNLFGTGTNIWGAGGNGNTQKMIDAGLLAPDAKEKAQSQSLMRGLLGAGVSYLSQPQNQNYGSITPYIGKALGAGMEAAQKPFDNLAKTANQNKTLNDLIKAKETETAVQKAKDNLYTTLPGYSYTANTPQASIDKIGPDGQKAIAPSFGLDSNTVDVPEMKVFNHKALADLAVNHPEEAAKILANKKTMKEIQTMGQSDAPDRWTAAEPEEAAKYGAVNGQINRKTGKFAGTDKNGDRITVDVPITLPGEKEEKSQSEIALKEQFVKDYLGLRNDSDAAIEDASSVDTALDLVNNLPSNATGFGSDALAGVSEAMSVLGVPIPKNFLDRGQLGQREFLESIANRLALGMRKKGSGVMTDKDFEVFKSMVGGLGNTKEANELILSFRNHINQRKTEIYEAAMEYRRGNTSFLKDENGNAFPKKSGELDAGFERWLHQQRLDSYEKTKQWKRDWNARKLGPGTRAVTGTDGQEGFITEIVPGMSKPKGNKI